MRRRRLKKRGKAAVQNVQVVQNVQAVRAEWGSLNNLNVLNDLNVWNIPEQKACLRGKISFSLCAPCPSILLRVVNMSNHVFCG